ncbi:hypothetical protein [Magnetococcus sp. PR-3]|uniref:hypothetical protein n=1 Tax=Magnetococcus sp. PR-3 TaxID=3120355 RepID=UPI002FCDEE10
MARKVYVASSWRNTLQPGVVASIRNAGHEVFDFRNPHDGKPGFQWSHADPNWQALQPYQYQTLLQHPAAVQGLQRDLEGMRWADCCVLVLPCERSAHTELGWFIAQNKPVAVLLDESEPELMYGLCDRLCHTSEHLISWLGEFS